MTERTPGPPRSLAREGAPDQQFWRLWRQGRRPDLRSFLSRQGALTPPEVASVVAIDQYERWLAGDRVRAEDYLGLLPAGPDSDQAACDVIYGEYLLREQLGERPSLDEYQSRFPEQASLLARQLELHHALADQPPPSAASSAPSSLPRRPSTHQGLAHAAPWAGPPVIPGYEVLEEIGRGGMGVVYKARQLSLDRTVALKVLCVHPGRDPLALDRMRREARVMARMSHPHIVTVFDAGGSSSPESPDRFYFAMEYVAGADLHRLVERNGPLGGDAACEYMRQAALGLQHAHEQGLVHRDVKPSNLIVTPAGVLKILDLGLARLSAPLAPANGPITQVGAFMGTPDFIAPEQANDPRDADIRSDLYSLGCTFYYALTGQAPFAGTTPFQKLMHHHIYDPPPLQELRPDLPAALCSLIRKLMSKRPEDRFSSPAELILVLGSLPGASKTAAPAPVVAFEKRRPVRAGLLRRLTGHADWVKCVAFSPDGGLLASGGLDRSVRLWQSDTFLEVWRGEGHTAAVLCLSFSPLGRRLVTGGQDRALCLWNLSEKDEGGRMKDEIKPSSVHPSSFRLHPSPGWRALRHTDNINAVAFTEQGRTIVSASHDGTLRTWEADSGRQVRAWSAHEGPVWGVAVAANGRLALSGGQDRMLRVWDVQAGESLPALPEQSMMVTCVAMTADGRYAASGGMDALVRLWDVSSRKELRSFAGHTGRITALAFSPNGKRLASGSRDKTLRILDVQTGSELAVFTGHTHWVTAVAWSPDGSQVVSGSVDRSVCVWAAPE
jgi:serine/threonine protein kinase